MKISVVVIINVIIIITNIRKLYMTINDIRHRVSVNEFCDIPITN